MPSGIGSNAAAQASRILNQYDPAREQDAQLIDLAAIYDPGQWFVMAEVLQRNADGILGESTAGYISGGYRWKQFTPYATWSAVDTDPRNDPGITLAGLPPQLRGLGGVINSQIVNRFSNALNSQQTLALGLRWDIGGKWSPSIRNRLLPA